MTIPTLPSGEVLTIFRGVDRSNGRAAVELTQDIEPVVDYAHHMATERPQSEFGRPIAEIPNILIAKWMYEEGVNVLRMSSEEFEQFITRRVLRDPDFRKLRAR